MEKLKKAIQARIDAASESLERRSIIATMNAIASGEKPDLTDAKRGSGTYRSCHWIEEGIFLAGDQVRQCCMQNIGNKPAPAFFKLSDPDASAERIVRERNALRLANQTSSAPCEGCYLLQKKEWQAKQHLRFVAIAGFLHCNLACSYCVTYAHDPQDRGEPILAHLKQWYEKGILRPRSSIDFGGGESTLHREFEEIAEFAFANEMEILVFTNGTMVSKGLLEGLRKRLTTIVISVDAGTRETYMRIKKKDMLDRVWATLRTYAQVNAAQTYVKYIVMDSNKSREEIDAFFVEAERAEVKKFRVSINTFQNVESGGKLTEPIKRAAAYVLRRGNELGSAELENVFAKPVADEIENLAKCDADVLMAGLSGAGAPGILELAYSDSEVFLDRARSIARERDSFVIQLGEAVASEAIPGQLNKAMVEAAESGAAVRPRTMPDGKIVAVDISFG